MEIHKKVGNTTPFSKFSLANEPFAGLLSPSTQFRIKLAILSGGAHLDISAPGILNLLASVSMTYGKIVTTLLVIGISFSSAI